MTAERRSLVDGERRLVAALRDRLRAEGLDEAEVRDAVAQVEAGLAARRPPPEPAPGDAPDRVHPVVVARAVAAVARPRLRPGRDVASVRVAEATPSDLVRELLGRLRRRRR